MTSTKSTSKKKTATESVPTQVTATPVQAEPKKLTRSTTDRIVFGVCGGLGEYLSIDPVILRLLFVILAISGGSGLLIYIVLGIVLPEKSSLGKSTKEVIQENSKNFEKTIEDVASNVEEIATKRNSQTWIGIGIIIVGTLLMANNSGIVAIGDVFRLFFRTLWPLAIIAVGLLILSKSNHGK